MGLFQDRQQPSRPTSPGSSSVASRARLAERLLLFIWAATKEGTLLSMRAVGKKHSMQLTEPHPDARAKLAMDFRLLFHDGDEANNLTICSHKQATCRVDNKIPTLTVADEDPFVLSPHGYF